MELERSVKFKTKFENSQTFLQSITSNHLRSFSPAPTEESGVARVVVEDPISVYLPMPEKTNAIKMEPEWLMEEEKTSRKDVPCFQCNEMFSSEIEVEIHAREDHVKPPKTHKKKKSVAKTYKRKAMKNVPVQQFPAHLDPKEYEFRNFKCSQCHKSYFTKPQLTAHVKDKHGQNFNLKCPELLCSKSFRNKIRLATHRRYAHGKRCVKEYPKEPQMMDHQEEHVTPPFPFLLEETKLPIRSDDQKPIVSSRTVWNQL